ncbi:hypothetical protein [Larkinella rosea]|uniref:Uncharacterized protein n=1 Tax=Larkinella rosea TaxID=2025312 RepID=A0A3P1BD31_9BACT|nr:hypothetical protein [Larkinella rosea]RRA99020.1 hypothetical protein EHT25_28995 [Larkinella rosea]
MKIWKTILALGVLYILTLANTFAQCAMCRGTVESTMSNGRNHVAVGLNTGILYLLATPYVLVAIVIFLWIRTSKKEHGKRLAIASRVRGAMSQM